MLGKVVVLQGFRSLKASGAKLAWHPELVVPSHISAPLRDNWCWNERFPVPRGLAFNQSQLTRSLGVDRRSKRCTCTDSLSRQVGEPQAGFAFWQQIRVTDGTASALSCGGFVIQPSVLPNCLYRHLVHPLFRFLLGEQPAKHGR